jgi:hypothetical protein
VQHLIAFTGSPEITKERSRIDVSRQDSERGLVSRGESRRWRFWVKDFEWNASRLDGQGRVLPTTALGEQRAVIYITISPADSICDKKVFEKLVLSVRLKSLKRLMFDAGRALSWYNKAQ